MEFNADLIEKNKSALLEEIASNLETCLEVVQGVSTSDVSENATQDSCVLRNSLSLLSQNLGYMAACFNQYMIFIRGEVLKNKVRTIGFGAFHDEMDEGSKKG